MPRNIIPKWYPSHSRIWQNDRADHLAKRSSILLDAARWLRWETQVGLFFPLLYLLFSSYNYTFWCIFCTSFLKITIFRIHSRAPERMADCVLGLFPPPLSVPLLHSPPKSLTPSHSPKFTRLQASLIKCRRRFGRIVARLLRSPAPDARRRSRSSRQTVVMCYYMPPVLYTPTLAAVHGVFLDNAPHTYACTSSQYVKGTVPGRTVVIGSPNVIGARVTPSSNRLQQQNKAALSASPHQRSALTATPLYVASTMLWKGKGQHGAVAVVDPALDFFLPRTTRIWELSWPICPS